MASIIINRTSEYLNRLRNCDVYIDGKKVDTISNGETKEFNISAGQHSILIKIDWCSSQILLVDINDNETKSFKVGGFKNGNWLIPAALVILSSISSRLFDFNYLFYLIIPFFLSMVYYMTLGRKQYLTLKENKLK